MMALQSVDYKFLLIPLVFIVLRVWSLIGDILHLYKGISRLSKGLSLILVILGVSNSYRYLESMSRNANDWINVYILCYDS